MIGWKNLLVSGFFVFECMVKYVCFADWSVKYENDSYEQWQANKANEWFFFSLPDHCITINSHPFMNVEASLLVIKEG